MSDETVLEVNEDGSTSETTVLKIKTVRASGRPVELEKLKEFEQEWKDGYDKIYDKKKNMRDVQVELQALSDQMSEKYDTILEWNMLTTEDEWKQAVKEYGSILISTHKDTGELMYVIMDNGL